MNIKYRIPTKDQFAFVEIDEDNDDISFGDIKRKYDALTNLFQEKEGGAGIPDKEFNKVLDGYLATKTIANGGDIYETLNNEQKGILNAIKKSFNRNK